MKAHKTLPETYTEAARLDLGQNKAIAVALNVVALIATAGFGFLFLRLAFLMRGEDAPGWSGIILTTGNTLLFMLEVLVISAVIVVVHELLHAVGFRAFTGEGAKFGFKGLYAYAGAPDWYLPRNQHIVTLLLPLVVITAVGVLLMVVVPPAWLAEVVLALVLNAAGAVGDLLALVWLLTKPPTAYVNDYGDGLVIFVASDAQERA